LSICIRAVNNRYLKPRLDGLCGFFKSSPDFILERLVKAFTEIHALRVDLALRNILIVKDRFALSLIRMVLMWRSKSGLWKAVSESKDRKT
jgi:hypothetical protein